MTYSVVWFKRDLRLHDHAALVDAAAHGPLLCLYLIEPSRRPQRHAARSPVGAHSGLDRVNPAEARRTKDQGRFRPKHRA